MTRQKILVPVDFSEGAAEALKKAIAMAGPLKAKVDVLHVCYRPEIGTDITVQVPHVGPRPLSSFIRSEAERELEAFTKPWRRKDRSIGAFVEAGEPRETILRWAAKGYTLVVMGTHGRTGFNRLVMGSVAEGVLRECPCPVLTVRPRKPAAKRRSQRDLVEGPAGGFAFRAPGMI
jgi:universal stress protein A